ncbi:MAG TPA: hypothetical protein VMI73_24140 [Trebonia sp.]|nr:hypothetical protein [Trebonia sp.]
MSDIHDQPSSGGAAGGTTQGTASAPSGSASASSGTYVPRPAPGYDDVRYEREGPSGLALGLTLMAAVFLMIAGIFDFFAGLAGLIRGSFFTTQPHYAFSTSIHTWGWLHLIFGAVVFVTGAALLTDRLWARIVGVVIASFSAVMNFVMLPYYPVWAFVVIALDIFVIWALVTPRNR